jgi:hypothetical protein
MAKINKVIINPLITLMFIVAFVVFIWGLFQLFVEQKGNEKSGFSGGLPQGKRHAIVGNHRYDCYGLSIWVNAVPH